MAVIPLSWGEKGDGGRKETGGGERRGGRKETGGEKGDGGGRKAWQLLNTSHRLLREARTIVVRVPLGTDRDVYDRGQN